MKRIVIGVLGGSLAGFALACGGPEAPSPAAPLVIAAAGEVLFDPPPEQAFEAWPPDGFGPAEGGAADAEPAGVPEAVTRAEDAGAQALAKALGEAREALGRLDFATATELLTGVLEGQPEHLPARYDLARAHALARRPNDATAALGVLGELARSAPHARQLLDNARVDPDFKTLRTTLTFRELTGATPLRITWVAGDTEAERRAQTLADALERDRWEVRLAAVGPDAAEGFVEGLAVRPNDTVARRVVRRVALLAGGLPVSDDPAAPADAPITIRLVGGGPQAEAAAPTPGVAVDLVPWQGTELKATAQGAMHALKLRATGFFEWRIVGPSGQQEQRRGKFEQAGGELRLTFRATRDTLAADGSGATTETRDKERLNLPLGLEGDALLVGDLRFTR